MLQKPAILLQDARPLYSLLLPEIIKAVQQNSFNLDPTKCLEWIIREEIDIIYNLFDFRHCRGHIEYQMVYYHVRNCLDASLSVLVRHYIKAPIVYADSNDVFIDLKFFDLYIVYTH